MNINNRLNSSDKKVFLSVLGELANTPSVQKMKKYIQHSDISTYRHCLRVTKKSLILARLFKLNVNREELIRGAMLHDYFLYDWHTRGDHLHGYHHPHIAARNAHRDFNLNSKELNIIESHMWPLTLFHFPRSTEAALVCIADKLCSTEEVTRWVTNALPFSARSVR